MRTEYDIFSELEDEQIYDYSSIAQYSMNQYDILETDTGSNINQSKYEIPLAAGLDVFENISIEIVQTMPRAEKFLNELRRYIIENSSDLSNFHYNKLSVEMPTRSGELMIDWIYNYFRVFFSFDDKEGDMYGLILNNSETKSFKSEFNALYESDYGEVAAKSIKFITENLIR